VALRSGLTLHAVGFTVAVVLASTLLVGVLPAFWSTKDLNAALKVGAGGAGGAAGVRAPLTIHRVLVGSQMALCMVLLVAAGLFSRTLGNLRRVDPGFDKNHIVLVSVNRGAVTAAVARELLPRFAAIPGVRSATFFANLGLLGGGALPSECPIDAVVATAGDDLGCVLMNVGPQFFETTAMQLAEGRTFVSGDEQPGTNVAIISEEMAHRYFGPESALGRRIRGKEIVGVVKNTKYGSLRDESQRTFYAPVQTAWMTADVRFVLRTDVAAAGLTNAVRAAVREVTPRFQVTSVQSLKELAESTLVRERLLVALSSSFGLLALLLACIGLYGTMAFAVARRTNEIGVRMALGARASTVVAQLMWETTRTVASGGLVGLGGVVLVARAITHLLFGLTPTDPVTIAATLLLLAAAAAIAAYLPARWASRVNPLVALRHE
jgi:putative ABC transport system permease protein